MDTNMRSFGLKLDEAMHAGFTNLLTLLPSNLDKAFADTSADLLPTFLPHVMIKCRIVTWNDDVE